MSTTTRSHLAVGLTLLCFAAAGLPARAFGADVSPAHLRPSVGIATASDELQWGHRRTDPLYVEVRVFNAVAGTVAGMNASNRRFLEHLRASELWRTFDENERRASEQRFAPVEPPRLVIGSEGAPAARRIEILIAGEDGRQTALPARLLAVSSDAPTRFELGSGDAATFAFGVDAAPLRKLPAGRYRLRARLDTRNLSEMWTGVVESDPLDLVLTDGAERRAADEELERLFVVGSFWLADRRFDELETIARRMIALDERSVGGWLHLGDALDGRGKPGEARDAFLRSRRLYYEDVVPTLAGAVEAPEYTLQRIREVEEKLAQGSR